MAIYRIHAEAQRICTGQVLPDHLLLGLIFEEEADVEKLLKHFAIDGKDLRSKIELQLAQLVKPDAQSQLTLSDEGRRIIYRAYNESRRLRSKWVEAEHILLALTREEKDTPVGKVLAESGLEGNTLCSEIISLQQRRRKERRAK
jgi:ATP-dependent Clp protease ATP-binding subunit ClpA